MVDKVIISSSDVNMSNPLDGVCAYTSRLHFEVRESLSHCDRPFLFPCFSPAVWLALLIYPCGRRDGTAHNQDGLTRNDTQTISWSLPWFTAPFGTLTKWSCSTPCDSKAFFPISSRREGGGGLTTSCRTSSSNSLAPQMSRFVGTICLTTCQTCVFRWSDVVSLVSQSDVSFKWYLRESTSGANNTMADVQLLESLWSQCRWDSILNEDFEHGLCLCPSESQFKPRPDYP